MGEELFTLLFILIIIAASVLDAAGRRRAKKRRMEEMEREEAEEAAGSGRAQERAEGPRVRRPPEPTAAEPASVPPEGERETAEAMVPEDLWAILTGQQPSRPQQERPSPQETEASAEPWEAPPREPHIPTPTPQDRMSTRTLEGTGSTPAAEEDRPTRRGARWMEGKRGRGESERWAAATTQVEAESREAMEEPWDEMEDIAAGDITAAEGELQVEETEGRPQPSRRRGVRGRGRYTQLLQTGDIEDLRKAVVLREILDRPVAFRERVGPDW